MNDTNGRQRDGETHSPPEPYEPAGWPQAGPVGVPPGATGPSSPAAPLPRRPAVAVAAAVLGFHAAALWLLGAVWLVTALSVVGGPDEAAAKARLIGGLLLGCAVAAMLLLGGISLIRGRGRVLLLVASGVELALVLGGAAYLVVTWSDTEQVPIPAEFQSLFDLGLITVLLAFAAIVGLPALRICLAVLPSVTGWLRAESAARNAQLWSSQEGRWIPASVSRRARGSLLAVLLPIGTLALVSVLVVLTTRTITIPGALGSGGGGEYRGNSDWGRDFYQGGEPLLPPAEGGPLYVAAADADARNCYDGDMAACDALFFASPVGDVYEWYGASCAGRLDYESDGDCVGSLGSTTD
ncbi:MAG: hypothetical protein AVDCRST_MAG52-1688 [uncultured Blastococcus sp.]|uniref:Uncharacterized protein n=1 Tax=uncultured Blastococcus sp. TaxID=217144 RepID=A0A6J4I7E9_9ACTN|nr:MAG: hypothetical protein AVDCRST_MAG52-1688 [uncultured Blastococcus sp.]